MTDPAPVSDIAESTAALRAKLRAVVARRSGPGAHTDYDGDAWLDAGEDGCPLTLNVDELTDALMDAVDVPGLHARIVTLLTPVIEPFAAVAAAVVAIDPMTCKFCGWHDHAPNCVWMAARNALE